MLGNFHEGPRGVVEGNRDLLVVDVGGFEVLLGRLVEGVAPGVAGRTPETPVDALCEALLLLVDVLGVEIFVQLLRLHRRLLLGLNGGAAVDFKVEEVLLLDARVEESLGFLGQMLGLCGKLTPRIAFLVRQLVHQLLLRLLHFSLLLLGVYVARLVVVLVAVQLFVLSYDVLLSVVKVLKVSVVPSLVVP